jgi:TPR repeat protein
MEILKSILIKSLDIENGKEIICMYFELKDIKYQKYIYEFYVNNISNSMALYFIGYIYENGYGVDQNYKIALEYY